MKNLSIFLIISALSLKVYPITYNFDNCHNISIINGKVFIDGKEVSTENVPEKNDAQNSNQSAITGVVTTQDDNKTSITVNISSDSAVIMGHVALSIQSQQ